MTRVTSVQTNQQATGQQSNTEERSTPVTIIDWSMVVLAVFSVGLLLWVLFADVSDETERQIYYLDTAICGVFAVEFAFRWRREGRQIGGWKFLRRNWYEILGMIPIANPALRSFRLIRIVVLVIRLWRASERAMGRGFTYGIIQRLAEPIVEAIRQPITVAVMDEVVAVIETGNYPKNIAESLEEHKPELRAIVAEKIREDQYAGTLKRLPFHDEIVGAVIDTAMRVIIDVLEDERVDDFFAEVVADNRAQIRQAVIDGAHHEHRRSSEVGADS